MSVWRSGPTLEAGSLFLLSAKDGTQVIRLVLQIFEKVSTSLLSGICKLKFVDVLSYPSQGSH